MLALPLPMLTFVLSAVACVLVWRLDLDNRLARGFFTGVFAMMATGTLLIGVRFGYGIENYIAIQRVIPLFVSPFIYLGFQALMQPAAVVRRASIKHLSVALVIAVSPQIIPQLRSGFDLAIGASYLVYSIALLRLWRKGNDGLAFAPLDLVQSLRGWMFGSAVMLALMLVFDTGIAISFAMQRADNAIKLISIGSVVSMITLILAIIVFSGGTLRRKGTSLVTPLPEDNDVRLEKSARDLLVQSQLYLDTNLTLVRLAKRLHVPARALSEAINQTQMMNVSQYVNGFRLEHAVKLLEDSELNVTQIMAQSGFLTRSNFYREFDRMYSVSPVEYRTRHFKK